MTSDLHVLVACAFGNEGGCCSCIHTNCTYPTGTALSKVAIPCAASIAPTDVFFVCSSRSMTYINAARTVPVHTESARRDSRRRSPRGGCVSSALLSPWRGCARVCVHTHPHACDSPCAPLRPFISFGNERFRSVIDACACRTHSERKNAQRPDRQYPCMLTCNRHWSTNSIATFSMHTQVSPKSCTATCHVCKKTRNKFGYFLTSDPHHRNLYQRQLHIEVHRFPPGTHRLL